MPNSGHRELGERERRAGVDLAQHVRVLRAEEEVRVPDHRQRVRLDAPAPHGGRYGLAVSYLLAVIGTQETRRADVPQILAEHRARRLYWDAKPRRQLAAGSRLVAKVAGVSEVWMTGRLLSAEPDPTQPNPFDPERWPYGYEVEWDAPAPRGIPAADVLGPHARARQLQKIARKDFLRCYRALYGEDPPRQDQAATVD